MTSRSGSAMAMVENRTLANQWNNKRSLSRKQSGCNVLSSSAETFALTKNKNAERELWQNLATISLEAKICLKARTCEINCTRAKSAKFLDRTAISMVRASTASEKWQSMSRSHTVPPPATKHRYAIPQRPTSMPELALRKQLYRTPKSLRSSVHTAAIQSSVERRIQNWIDTQITFNKNTGVLSQNLLVV